MSASIDVAKVTLSYDDLPGDFSRSGSRARGHARGAGGRHDGTLVLGFSSMPRKGRGPDCAGFPL